MPRGAKAQKRRTDRRQAHARGKGGNTAPAVRGERIARAGIDLSSWDDIQSLLGLSAREKAAAALTAAGMDVAPVMQTSYELAQEKSVAERTYLSRLIEAGFTETRRASWPCEEILGDHGEVLYRDESSGVFRLDDGTVAYVGISGGWAFLRCASPSRTDAAGIVETFQAEYPPLYRATDEDEHVVPITFWTNGKWGAQSRLRMIDSASWGDIERNYSADVQAELARLMSSFEPGKDGQLLLWQGSPGTGKTWALRALASEWASWAEFSYITDPDAFFVDDPSYMIDVLLHESYEQLTVDGDVVTETAAGDKWRVLILEDTGELLSANAKEAYGQGLSRLLNVVDGMVGQGLRVLALVTTNDELGDLHPAVTRPGRCASQIEFGPLSADEATAWIDQEGVAFEAPMSLAELFQARGDHAEAFDADTDSEDREPMSGTCSCGHMASRHDGDFNDGSCLAENCSCDQFDQVDEPDDDGDMSLSTLLTAWPTSVTSSVPFTTFGTATGSANTANPLRLTFGETTFTMPDGRRFLLADGELAELDLTPGGVVPATRPDVEIKPPEPGDDPLALGTVKWEAVLCPEGVPTDDGRIFAPGSISWREVPLSLMGMVQTADGHDGAEVCGRIDAIWRDEEASVIRGAGDFDTGDFGSMIARLVDDRVLRGISVDIAVSEMEVVPREEVLDADGNWIENRDQPADDDREEPTLLDVLFGDTAEQLFVVREGIIGAATVCPFQAFREATIEVASSLTASVQSPNLWTVTTDTGYRLSVTRPDATGATETPADGEEAPVTALTASAAGIAPETPPADWFSDPEFDELTALTITDDGEVFGHAAAWDTCHIGIPGVCTTAPTSHSDYAYFHLKEVALDDGSRVSCGTITLDTGHAGRDSGRAAAARHYDDTGTAVADVIVGEDEYGIWLHGALRGDVSEEAARKLRGAVLSGDWRDVNGNLELVALLAVNVPGFPVPRTPAALVASVDDGLVVESLIAAGIHNGKTTIGSRMQAQFAALSIEAEFGAIGHEAEHGAA